MTVPKITRADLLAYLEGESSRINENLEKWTFDRENERRILNAAIDGLRALDGGEVPAIFLKTTKKSWGKRPVQIRQLQIKALQHIASLRVMACPAGKARDEVAKAYGITVDVINQWRRRLKKLGEIDGFTIDEHEHYTASIQKTLKKWGRSPGSAALLKQIQRDGAAFIKARTEK